jgi:hypothetical protein
MTMGRRGRKRRLGVEDGYWQLILAGTGAVEACKLVGVGRKTGYRWRAENGGLPPLRRVEHQRCARYPSLLEQQRIATLRRQGFSMREFSRRLGRAPSTISRELRRNTAAHDLGGYDGDLAHRRAGARERVPAAVGSRPIPGCVERFSPSWNCGARSRSRPGYGSSARTCRVGTCVTRRSTRRFTTARKAV